MSQNNILSKIQDSIRNNMAEQTKDQVEEEKTVAKPVPEIDSKYRKIILAAQRSKQLQRGAMPRNDMEMRNHKPTRIAMQELEAGMVNFEVTKDKKTQ